MILFLRQPLSGRAPFRADFVTTRPLAAACATKTLAVLAAFGLVAGFAASAFAQAAPEGNDEKAFYSIGTSMASQLDMVKPITDRELDLLIQGIRDGVGGRALVVEQQEGATLVRALLKERQEKSQAVEQVEADRFLTSEASKKGARKTESGLIYTEIKAGTGASPAATDKVRVHYHGTLRDGTVFDSSRERGPAEFPLNGVIPCWTEGVALMKVGGRSTLVCPADIAYGDRGSQGRIPGGAALSFDVELLEIVAQ